MSNRSKTAPVAVIVAFQPAVCDHLAIAAEHDYLVYLRALPSLFLIAFEPIHRQSDKKSGAIPRRLSRNAGWYKRRLANTHIPP